METITNNKELREAVTLLTAEVQNMCNTTAQESAVHSFVNSKDLLILIYKYNIERLSNWGVLCQQKE